MIGWSTCMRMLAKTGMLHTLMICFSEMQNLVGDNYIPYSLALMIMLHECGYIHVTALSHEWSCGNGNGHVHECWANVL